MSNPPFPIFRSPPITIYPIFPIISILQNCLPFSICKTGKKASFKKILKQPCLLISPYNKIFLKFYKSPFFSTHIFPTIWVFQYFQTSFYCVITTPPTISLKENILVFLSAFYLLTITNYLRPLIAVPWRYINFLPKHKIKTDTYKKSNDNIFIISSINANVPLKLDYTYKTYQFESIYLKIKGTTRWNVKTGAPKFICMKNNTLG